MPNALTARRQPFNHRRPASRPRCKRNFNPSPASRLDPLEPRTLFSASFSTIDTFQLSSASGAAVYDSVTDAQGNLYIAGKATDAAGTSHGIVRERIAATGAWTTLLVSATLPSFRSVAVDPVGNLFVAAGGASISDNLNVWSVLERRAGQTAFDTVDQLARGNCMDLTVSPTGDVFAVGGISVSVRNASQDHWIVRKLASGASAFTTVDDFIESGISLPRAITSVPTGPAAGLYAVGDSLDYGFAGIRAWVVRRSTNGGLSWSTVDKFLLDPYKQAAATAWNVAGDAAGNLFVVGSANTTAIVSYDKKKNPVYGPGPYYSWVVRKGTLGINGAFSWSISDNFQLAPGTSSSSRSLVVDAAGNVFVAGTASDGARYHSIVRALVNGAWSTVDDFQLDTSLNSYGGAITVDSSGTLYLAGTATTASANPWFVRSASTLDVATTSATTTSTTTTNSAVAPPSDSLQDPLLAPLL